MRSLKPPSRAGLGAPESAAFRPRASVVGELPAEQLGPDDNDGEGDDDRWHSGDSEAFVDAARRRGGRRQGDGPTTVLMQLDSVREPPSQAGLGTREAVSIHGGGARWAFELATVQAAEVPGMVAVQMHLLLDPPWWAGLRRLEPAAVRPRAFAAAPPVGDPLGREQWRSTGLCGLSAERVDRSRRRGSVSPAPDGARQSTGSGPRRNHLLLIRPRSTGTHGAVVCAGAATWEGGEERGAAVPPAIGLLHHRLPHQARLGAPAVGDCNCSSSYLTRAFPPVPEGQDGRCVAEGASGSALHGAAPWDFAKGGGVRTGFHDDRRTSRDGHVLIARCVSDRRSVFPGATRHSADRRHWPTGPRADAAQSAPARCGLHSGLGAGFLDSRREEEAGEERRKRIRGRNEEQGNSTARKEGGGGRFGTRATSKVVGNVYLPPDSGARGRSRFIATFNAGRNARGTARQSRVVADNGENRGTARIEKSSASMLGGYAAAPREEWTPWARDGRIVGRGVRRDLVRRDAETRPAGKDVWERRKE